MLKPSGGGEVEHQRESARQSQRDCGGERKLFRSRQYFMPSSLNCRTSVSLQPFLTSSLTNSSVTCSCSSVWKTAGSGNADSGDSESSTSLLWTFRFF